MRFIAREQKAVSSRPEALTFACKKQNHSECFYFYPGISERAELTAYYAQPNMNLSKPVSASPKLKKKKAVFCIIYMAVKHIFTFQSKTKSLKDYICCLTFTDLI